MLSASENAFAAVKVIGIGGAGGNAVSYMLSKEIPDTEFAIMNTDAQALEVSSCSQKVRLGESRGMWEGPHGRQSAMESQDKIAVSLRGAKIVILVAGMGGDTGTGATPVVAQIAKEMGIPAVCVVTTPFLFEGKRRMDRAQEGIGNLLNTADGVIVVHNEAILQACDFLQTTMQDVMRASNEVLFRGVRCLTELINHTGFVNIDVEAIRQTLQGAGFNSAADIRFLNVEDRTIPRDNQHRIL